MIIKTQEDVTKAVLAELEKAENPRFREIRSYQDYMGVADGLHPKRRLPGFDQ